MVTIDSMTRTKGIAGQFAIDVAVTYPNEHVMHVRFVGSIYGGPIVMVTEREPRGEFVAYPSRFGNVLNDDWVRAFFDQSTQVPERVSPTEIHPPQPKGNHS